MSSSLKNRLPQLAIAGILGLGLMSCQSEKEQLIKQGRMSDYIEVNFDVENAPAKSVRLVFNTGPDKDMLLGFIGEKLEQKAAACPTNGTINYVSRGETQLSYTFSIEEGCDQITYNGAIYALSPEGSNFLGSRYENIKRIKSGEDGPYIERVIDTTSAN